jgi:flagellar basal body-associated protein FliL
MRKKLFRYFVYFVVAMFFLSIPGMYVAYIFIPKPEQSNNQSVSQQKTSTSTQTESKDNPEQFFKQLEQEVATGNLSNNMKQNQVETGLNLTGNR